MMDDTPIKQTRAELAEQGFRRALQEIATGKIHGEPDDKAAHYWLVRAIALKALEDFPEDEPRYFRDGVREPVEGPLNP